MGGVGKGRGRLVAKIGSSVCDRMGDRVPFNASHSKPCQGVPNFDFGSLEREGRRSFDCKDDGLEEGDHTLAGMAGYRTRGLECTVLKERNGCL